MNSLKNIVFITALFLQTVAFGQSAKRTFCVKLVFHTMIGNQPLALDSNYTTLFGDTFSITKFKYYISHISFFTADGKEETITDNYFLIDEGDSSSKIITLQIATKAFTQLRFLIGVDSAKNVGGVQTGALDPANGMFWTWNSGYIMAKLEGKSPQSKAPFGNITYHVGGFSAKENVARVISLHVNQNMKSEININVDLNKWFNGPHPIKISNESFCMSSGKMAMEIADNYANMFSIKSISLP